MKLDYSHHTMPIRIGILTDVYRPGFSGVANHVMLLKKCLSEMGHQVRIFSFETQARSKHEGDVIFSPGITVAANYPFGLRLSRPARQMIQTMDILHIHQPFASGYIAIQQHKKSGVPLVFTSHTRYDLFSKAYLPWIPSNLSLSLIQRYLRDFSKQLSLIIAPAPEMAGMLKTWEMKAPVQVIPNGIDLSAFRNIRGQAAGLRARFGLPEDTFIFLYAGRIAPEKNIPFLIQCFAKAVTEIGRAVLVLIGGGPKFKEIQSFIQTNRLDRHVFMTGPIDYQEIPALMHEANVFVTASKSEVHPLTVIEAAAAGLPVIGLHAPGVASIVQNQVTGYLCPENQAEFTGRMVFLANQPEIARQMGENAARSAEEYSYTITAQRILDAYQVILNSN